MSARPWRLVRRESQPGGMVRLWFSDDRGHVVPRTIREEYDTEDVVTGLARQIAGFDTLSQRAYREERPRTA